MKHNNESIRIRKNQFILDIIFGIIFLICSVSSKIIYFSYISVGFFIIYLIYTLYIDSEFVIKYLAFIFMAIAAILGTLIIEFSKVYLIEIRCSSYYVGALPLLIFAYWTLIIILRYADKRKKISLKNFDGKFNLKILTLFTICTLIIYLIMFGKVISRPAFILHIDRFSYAKSYGFTGILAMLEHTSTILLVFPILLFINGRRIISSITVLIYILYYLWTGNKFGPFFSLLCVFLLVYYQKIFAQRKTNIKKIFLLVLIFFSFLLILAIYVASSGTSSSATAYFSQRTAQQGQLWWKTYDICNGKIYPIEFQNEIKSIYQENENVSNNVGANYGIYKIMYLCAPKTVVDDKLRYGSRYTEAGYATVYYYFGYAGVVIFSIIMGSFIAWTINMFIKTLNYGDYIKSLIFLRFFMIERNFISMFILADFFDFISIISYLYLILLWKYKIRIDKNSGKILKFVKIYAKQE